MENKITLIKYAPSLAIVVPKNPTVKLAHINKSYLQTLLSEYGSILLRDFNSDIESFSALIEQVSSKVTLDPARTFFSKVAQKVDAGVDAVGLHLENGNSPFRAQLAWFYCQEAPTVGSRTTICDGVKVWNALPETLQKRFESTPIIYSRRVDSTRWKTMALHLHPQLSDMEQVTFEHLSSLCNPKDTRISHHKDDSITYEYETYAAYALNDGKMAVANSILGPSYNYEKPVIKFKDGELIESRWATLLNDVTERITIDVPWQDGDIALIDNNRTMHGRRKIVDDRRVIFNALSDF
ncbi:TauD/TfdA family dioxygenase [Thalassotalea fusca]